MHHKDASALDSSLDMSLNFHCKWEQLPLDKAQGSIEFLEARTCHC